MGQLPVCHHSFFSSNPVFCVRPPVNPSLLVYLGGHPRPLPPPVLSFTSLLYFNLVMASRGIAVCVSLSLCLMTPGSVPVIFGMGAAICLVLMSKRNLLSKHRESLMCSSRTKRRLYSQHSRHSAPCQAGCKSKLLIIKNALPPCL